MRPLVDGEKEFLLDLEALLLVCVSREVKFRLVETTAFFRVFQRALKSLVARLAEFDFIEQLPVFLGLPLLPKLLRVRCKAVAEHCLLAHQILDHRLEAVKLVGGNRCRTRDDQRRARLVDKNGIHLVHDREKMPALNLLLTGARHPVVAQVIESKLRIHPVGDVGRVLLPPGIGGLVVLEHSGGEAKKPVDLSHPLGIATGEIIVGRHQMRPPSAERVQEQRQRRDKSFSLASGHFSDDSAMQADSPD